MSGYRQRIHEPRFLIYKPRRYTVHELYSLRHRLHFLSCPLEKFSPEAFQYLIVTPHIPASADIEPRIRQQILRTLVKLDEERMATISIPPHLRKLAAGRVSNPGHTTNSVVSEPITPLTIVYSNVVGNEALKEPEMPQTVDVDMADAWWAQLAVNQKVEIAEPYIMEGRELPSPTVPKAIASSPGAVHSTGGYKPNVPKANLDPTVSSFKMSALKEVVPNVLVGTKTQDECAAPSATTNQDDWGSSSTPNKYDSWDTQPIQPKQGDWSTPSTWAKKGPPTLTKQDASSISTRDDWTTSLEQDKGNVSAISKKEILVTADSWDDPSPSARQPQLISIESSQPKTDIVTRIGTSEAEDEDRLIPPHKPGWIGMRSNAAEQEEFIRFMTAKVFPRVIPKKPALDTCYAMENPPPAPADTGDWATGPGNSGCDW